MAERVAEWIGGVLRRPGHTEAAVDLAVLVGLRPSGTLCELVSEKDPTGMARGEELRVFADEHDLCMISIADLIAYRKRFDKLVERVAEAIVQAASGRKSATSSGSACGSSPAISTRRGTSSCAASVEADPPST